MSKQFTVIKSVCTNANYQVDPENKAKLKTFLFTIEFDKYYIVLDFYDERIKNVISIPTETVSIDIINNYIRESIKLLFESTKEDNHINYQMCRLMYNQLELKEKY